MKLRFVGTVFAGALLVWGLSLSAAQCSTLRITMNDGTNVEVPYYWEEAGEIKFEIPGGVAGLPKGQVKSVQEVITAREFDPQVLLESPKDSAAADQREILENLMASKSASGAEAEKVDTEDGLRMLKAAELSKAGAALPPERVYAPKSQVRGNFAELVKSDGRELVLVMRNVLSSRSDLKNQRFMLTLYDAEGKVLQQKPCELRELDADNKTLKDLSVRGHLFSVVASVKPDPKIKRYEITAVQN
jgi:hypothetical protein